MKNSKVFRKKKNDPLSRDTRKSSRSIRKESQTTCLMQFLELPSVKIFSNVAF